MSQREQGSGQKMGRLTPAQAITRLRTERCSRELIRDSYLDTDSPGYWNRFRESAEFTAITRLLGRDLRGLHVLDLGAGVGMSALAFAQSGAGFVCAAEPDASEVVGYGSLCGRPLDDHAPVVVPAVGEALPFADESFDLVYCRQVLHHARDLTLMVAEMARVTRRGGQVLASREHVVRNDRELARFLMRHPVHAYTGNEHAFRLAAYEAAFSRAGLRLMEVLRPFDSVINAFPRARSDAELAALPARWLGRLGALGPILVDLPGMDRCVRTMAARRSPGSMYTFLAIRP